ncbi:MAG: hypothetical protein ACWA41_08990 [Putridiphycobacter sp.]
MKEENKKRVIELLKTKSLLKQKVHKNTVEWFDVFKSDLKNCIEIIEAELADVKGQIRLKIVENSSTEVQLFIGSDVLVFQMHTNVFKIPRSNYVHKSSYIKTNPFNAFCGVINIYNFLADSYEYNRYNDLGYLISRVFINQENHFFIEGKGELEFLYRDFLNQTLDQEIIKDIILRVAAFAIDFDLLTPPYDKVSVATVQQVQAISSDFQLKTGKRLGFKFKSENDIMG